MLSISYQGEPTRVVVSGGYRRDGLDRVYKVKLLDDNNSAQGEQFEVHHDNVLSKCGYFNNTGEFIPSEYVM